MIEPLNVAFIHPDLGHGGAERLVVDAALHLQSAGHRVTIFTAHHDPARCFEETRDGTLRVRVHGDGLPAHIGQRLRVPCVIARMAWVAAAMARRAGPFDLIVCDGVAHIIPLLRALSRAPIVLYGHFPDLLLSPPRRGWYRWYRAPIDWLEAVTTVKADRVLVNSRFTAAVFRETFARYPTLQPEVLYPGVDPERYATVPPLALDAEAATVLSLCRYDASKNVSLAIDALAALRERHPAEFARARLVVAGGYDERLRENRQTLDTLQARVRDRQLDERVVFLRSVSEVERLRLLAECTCVVYTPAREHFGYVPVEAMAAGRPVVAVDAGGPAETVRHGATGWLCPPTPVAFAEALAHLLADAAMARRMGEAGREHVRTHFSRAAFGARLDAAVRAVLATPQRRPR